MTVNFVVEDGSIVPGANSYVTVEQATAYIDQNIFYGPKWDALSPQQQQSLLIWATRYLDQRTTWNGYKATDPYALSYGDCGGGWDAPSSSNIVGGFLTEPALPPTQPLRWPRVGVRDVDGVPIPRLTIPQAVMDATSEMARYLIDQDRSVERPQDGLKMLKADVVELVFKGDYYLPAVPAQIGFILRGLGQISSGNLGFGLIRRA